MCLCMHAYVSEIEGDRKRNKMRKGEGVQKKTMKQSERCIIQDASYKVLVYFLSCL